MSNVRLTQTAAKELLIAHLRALVKECRLFHELQGHDDVIPRGECDPICDAMKAAEKALRAYDANASTALVCDEPALAKGQPEGCHD